MKIILKFLKFGIVGFSGMILDLGITYLFKDIFLFSPYLSNTSGFTLAVFSNYYLNKYWTFEEKNKTTLNQASKFYIISLIGLGISSLSIYILYTKFELNFYLAKMTSIAITSIWNFTINTAVVFNSKQRVKKISLLKSNQL